MNEHLSQSRKPRKHTATQGVAQALGQQGHHQFRLVKAYLHLASEQGLGAADPAVYEGSIPVARRPVKCPISRT